MSEKTNTTTRSPSRLRLPVALYVPNLMGYARIWLAFWGLYEAAKSQPVTASWIWLTSASLDLWDGMLARKLNQCSQLGVLLDIAADNLLRSCMWMAAVVANVETYNQSPVVVLMAATFIITLEWMTMICTQLHATTSSEHWKSCRTNDPWWIQMIFANNFKTPQGVLCIGGLFGSGYVVYAQTQPILVASIPYFGVLRNLALLGRGLTMMAEIWICRGYLSHVIAKDTEGVAKFVD